MTTILTPTDKTKTSNPNGDVPKLISEEGAALASATAPASALDAKTAPRPSNPVHDSMAPIFSRT